MLDHLKNIEKNLEAPKKILFEDFMNFLKQYGVVGLAIAVILGGKLNELVSSLVNDLLMPIVFQPALRAANVDDIKKLSFHGIFYGKFLGTALDFLIVSFVVFLIVKYIIRDEKLLVKK